MKRKEKNERTIKNAIIFKIRKKKKRAIKNAIILKK
jgi:hypothetical protein